MTAKTTKKTPKFTSDQARLLIMVSKLTRPAKSRHEEETWIKKIPLMALISRGIQVGIFKGYDFAPILVEYMGTTRFASISKESEDDIADLRKLGYIERLKLATSHYVYVSAYRITNKGLKAVAGMDKKHHDVVGRFLSCKKCAHNLSIQAKEDAPYLVCKHCETEKVIDIFYIEEISYASSPMFADVWLPMD
jgi:hypothetical protein